MHVVMGMTITELVPQEEVLEQEGLLNSEILDVTEDSRAVKNGSLFVAIKGEQTDGHEFISKAISHGAVGIIVQDSIEACRARLALDSNETAWVRVKNSRQTLGMIAGRLNAEPTNKLHMIGVTGTNGKTTVTYLIKTLLEAHGEKVGVLGTVGYVVGDDVYEASHTTPSSVTLQRMLGKMVQARMDHAILEVSSHALALDRVEGCRFDVAVFTNLTQDHLDFHENMETYFQAKARLFVEYFRQEGSPNAARAIINEESPWGARLKRECTVPVWTYGLDGKPDLHATNIQYSMTDTQFSVTTPIGTFSLTSPLVGEHNVYNMLAAIGVAIECGCSIPTIQKGVKEAGVVPGRFEQVNEGQDFVVIVDYAHTDDALARLLTVAQRLSAGRVLTVVGCGGDRDSGKRPKMGKVAAELSDYVIVTSDNPRTEDPLRIIQEVECGVLSVPESTRATYQVLVDRREAISRAIREARTNDMVVIAGKGHEDYQIIGTTRFHFDDREEARNALRLL